MSDDLDWVFDPSDEDITSHAGKILLLTFEALEMEDFETDQSYREMPPMQLTLECYVKGKISRQSMVMLPSKIALENNQSVWNYPLILTKLSKGVLNIVLEIFLSDYFATMSPLNITPKTIEHVIFVNLDQYRTPDDDMNMKPQGLLLEYSTGSEELKTIQFEILPDQLVKISALAGGPDKFYQAFCTHILKTTHVKLAALQLKSLSCDILTLSTESSKIKVCRDELYYACKCNFFLKKKSCLVSR